MSLEPIGVSLELYATSLHAETWRIELYCAARGGDETTVPWRGNITFILPRHCANGAEVTTRAAVYQEMKIAEIDRYDEKQQRTNLCRFSAENPPRK